MPNRAHPIEDCCGIDLAADDLLSVDDVRSFLPTKPSRGAVYGWMRDGLGGVRLAAVRVGRRLITSRNALQLFVDATNGHEARPGTIRTPGARARAMGRARRNLVAKGVLDAGTPRGR